jgi:signal transduction histidine kinase
MGRAGFDFGPVGKAVTTISSSDEGSRRPCDSASADSTASFEEFLERLLQALKGSADHESAIQEALDLIAAYFSVERAVVTVPGCPPPVADKTSVSRADLQEEIVLGPDQGVGTVALFAPQRAGSWTDRDARQLRIAAQPICEALCRVKAASELREQQIWLLMAMESATVGVWDWDLASDRVRFVSPFDARGDGLRVRETEGSDWFEQTHPEDAVVSRPEVDRAISGETDAFSMVVRQRGGPDREAGWLHLYSRGRVIERDPTGRALRMMGTFEDVTEAHLKAQAEKEREAAMARTARMASLGALASSLAHDLNQPLAALTSFLEGSVRMISKGTATDTDVVEALERSVSFAHRASDIVRSFRRLLQRAAPLRDPVDLSSLLLEVRERLKREAAAAAVEIEVADGPGPTVVRGDSLQIEQVLIHLVRNAIEALGGTGRRPRTVTLTVRQAGGLVEVRVSDTGPGIPDSVVDRLFKPLATSEEAGRGLGLVICHSIAEIHGGRLDVERTGPEGTTFVLALPRDDGGVP